MQPFYAAVSVKEWWALSTFHSTIIILSWLPQLFYTRLALPLFARTLQPQALQTSCSPIMIVPSSVAFNPKGNQAGLLVCYSLTLFPLLRGNHVFRWSDMWQGWWIRGCGVIANFLQWGAALLLVNSVLFTITHTVSLSWGTTVTEPKCISCITRRRTPFVSVYLDCQKLSF